jgi:hypothetical protein
MYINQMLENTAISHIRYLSYLLPYLVIGQSYIGFLVIVVQAVDIIGKHGKVINEHGSHGLHEYSLNGFI